MKKILLVMLLILVGCSSSIEVEKVGGYEYKMTGVKFTDDTETFRSFFENELDDKDLVNMALAIYENGDYTAWRNSDEEDIVEDINALYNYYVNNNYKVTKVKMLFAYAIYNRHSLDREGRYYERVYEFIDFMEKHEYEYISENINKWKYSEYQTLVNKEDKEKYKDFYHEYVVNVLKRMN